MTHIALDGLFHKKYSGITKHKKAYESAQMFAGEDFYDDVVRNERVPNTKKYINREVLYELSYANSINFKIVGRICRCRISIFIDIYGEGTGTH